MLLLVGACLCYRLQSQSVTDPHLCAWGGMDWKSKVPQVLCSGTKIDKTYHPTPKEANFQKKTQRKYFDSVNQNQLRKTECCRKK